MQNENIDKVSKSYLSHTEQIKNSGDSPLDMIRTKDSAAYHSIITSLKPLNPFLKKTSTWLTIGDFYGFEANYLRENNQTVTASDVSDEILRIAKNENLIDDFRAENVEHINLPENSYEYVLCKQAFHHFPKAYLGIYEMLRVAKKGIILMEPTDALAKMPILLFIKNVLDIFSPSLINKFWKNRFSWESVGNYVFKTSEREIEKIAMGMGLPCIAFKGINLFLSVDKYNIHETPTNYTVLKKIHKKIAVMNFWSKLRLIPYNNFCAVILKETDEELLKNLKAEGFTVIKLPENPYM